MKRLRLLGCACGLLASTAMGASDCAFWVWHRRDPLRTDERQALTEMQASLLWHVGELDLADAIPPNRPQAQWRWRDALPEPGAIPVVRLNLSGSDPFNQEGLMENIAGLANTQGRLQIDCDCPDRLLSKYARFLGELRKRVPHLSVTALAGWSGHAAFGALQESVESIDVMFYDLAPDVPRISPENPPYPLLDERVFTRQLASWQGCKVPWRTGLPNFSRVTVFDATGRSLGQIRNWTWDEVVFQSRLKFVSTPGPGLVLMKVTGDLVMAETPIKAGAFVAVRWVDRETLVRVMDMVKKSASVGPVFFRLPDSSDPSGWSVSQLREMLQGRIETAKFGLHKEAQGFVLQNTGAADLPPRLGGDGPCDRGYALEIDAPAHVWREAMAGDFWRVAAHVEPDTKPVAVPVAFATRLTFWFSRLRAGENLKTGLIQLAPDTDLQQIRFRILPGDQQWKPIE